MIQQNELITFLIGTGAVCFILLNRRRIAQIPRSSWLLVAYGALYAGWVLTLAEGFVWPSLLNLLEHASYMLSSVAMGTWCWKALARGSRTG